MVNNSIMDNNNMPMNKHEGMTCSCPHHKIVPLCIIIIGLLVLAANLGWLTASFVGIVWPILLVVIGVMKFMKGKCKCCSK